LTTPLFSTITNTVHASAANTPDPGPTSNDAAWGTIIQPPKADLSVTKSGTPASPAPGAELTYTVTASSAGPSTATSTVVSDSIPAGTTFLRLSSGTGCASPPVGGGGDLTCSIASFASGASTTLVFVVKTPSSTPAGTVIANTATVTSGTADPVPADDVTSTLNTVGPASADLAVTKTGPTSAIDGAEITYTITAT